MKKQLFLGITIITLGLLIALGPQFLFKTCAPAMSSNNNCGDGGNCGCGGGDIHMAIFPTCRWSARAEIGIGAIIIALGICLLLFLDEPKTRLGLSIGIFFNSIASLLIPNILIGGCSILTMQCQKIAFPILSVISIVLLLCSITNIIYLSRHKIN